MSGSSSSNSSPTKPSRQPINTGLTPLSPRPPLSRSPSSSSFPPPPPLHLTIRFSSSLPDLQLDVQNPAQTTVAALKHTIRGRLSPPNNTRKLRFIHAGKILPDGSALGSVLKVIPPPPQSNSKETDPRGKGKGVEGRDAAAHRVYVNCSIGDELSEEDLDAEAKAALAPAIPAGSGAAAAANQLGGGSGGGGGTSTGAQLHGATGADGLRSTAAAGGGGAAARAPRGFDRLLSAGFTPAEVNALRLQFRTIQAFRYTPDTMPSPSTLRSMEDAWIDNNNAGTMAGGGGGGLGGGGEDGGGPGDGGEESGISGMLDIIIRGMVIGFFWPLGFIGWLMREEGLWSRRWKVFASFGFILSLTIGAIRAISGDR